ncbi:MAG: TetR/AcrR family transcriptional regulator [Alphaproteobacteria bacterium]|nr:TetR/AcrR family transcriptional regulator [Alphaproteobacteria bacterium]
MARKKATRRKVEPADLILDAALTLASAKPWARLSMAEIARAARMKPAAVQGLYADKMALVAGLMRRVDQQVAQRMGSENAAGAPRDALFDTLMERFDVMNEQRSGFISILRGAAQEPVALVTCLPQIQETLQEILSGAGLEANGPCGMLRIIGLGAVYARALSVWMNDESADLSKTMATVDQTLTRAEQAAGVLGL